MAARRRVVNRASGVLGVRRRVRAGAPPVGLASRDGAAL